VRGWISRNATLLEEEEMSSPALLRVTVEPHGDALLIRAAGEVDLGTVPTLRRELDVARAAGSTALLDLSEITFMDSTGLHLLLQASRRSADSEWVFHILRPSQVVQRLIAVSGTADLLALGDPDATRAPG
jgi:anti-sigma B factor antagonist